MSGRRLLTAGEGVWHLDQPDGTFTYLELRLDAISYNVGLADNQAPTHAAAAVTATAGDRRNHP